jgi:cyclopropane fatty-acyl-phospholipid synthase-like methyltransferase
MQVLERLKKLAPPAVKRLVKPLLPKSHEEADRYVATDRLSGMLQFELLRRQGCQPGWKVLEIGCGNLHASVPVIQYLAEGNYVGVDPNEWLRKVAMKNRDVRQLVKEKRARFLSVGDFDSSRLGITFDLIFSHSVLSHCAHWQLGIFLKSAAKVLAPGGRVLASIRLAEGNAYGSEGTPDRKDSMHEAWEYPGVSWFRFSTVRETADKEGLKTDCLPEYTEFYTKTRPGECHDWLVFSRKIAE